MYRHDPAKPGSLSSNAVVRVYEDHKGVIWIGTGIELNRFDRTTETFTHYGTDPDNPESLYFSFWEKALCDDVLDYMTDYVRL